MSIVFTDDKPVTCDCGCTVYSGTVYESTVTVMYRGKPKTIIFTYCDETGHDASAMYDALQKYQDIEHHIIQTKEDKENEYGDIKHDELD